MGWDQVGEGVRVGLGFFFFATLCVAVDDVVWNLTT